MLSSNLTEYSVISSIEDTVFDLRLLKHGLRGDYRLKDVDRSEYESVGNDIVAELEALNEKYEEFKKNGSDPKINLTITGEFGTVQVTERDGFLLRALQLDAKLKKVISDTEKKYFGPKSNIYS